MTLQACVKNGIKFLNKVKPGWYKKIKLKELNLMEETHCILGQLYGNYWDAAAELKLAPNVSEFNIESLGKVTDATAPYGFSIHHDLWEAVEEKNGVFLVNTLTEIWRGEIRKLRTKKVV